MTDKPITILCLASYEKGFDFLRECHAQGAHVIFLTLEKLAKVPWPHEAIDEVYYMPSLHDREAVVNAVSYLARTRKIDRIVPLDDFDLEMAATLREHMRIPGMGETTTRYFRDKLAMRIKARESGILVPDFCAVLNYDDLRHFMENVPGPWVLKPRSEASSVGISKLHHADELWPLLDKLGDRQSHYVLEQYIPGQVFHVDSIVVERKVQFAEVSRYLRPPLDVMQGGGVFTSMTMDRESDIEQALLALNRGLVDAMGLVRGVTHSEFIRADADGRFYFLENAARVGGANLADMIEAAAGVNLWREWAKLELAGNTGTYRVPPRRYDYAGIIISLTKQEWPDDSEFDDPEIVWRMKKSYHIGLIAASAHRERVLEFLSDTMTRILRDYAASLPPPDKVLI